jgi:NAD(P)-dependent dehydrogenase (short-subunit alcohol dehydrogenase family)
MPTLTGKRVLVIGGGSGIGLASARLAYEAGARVTIAGRTEAKLARAAASIGDVDTRTVDLTEQHSVDALFAGLDAIDHLVLPGSDARFGGLRDLPVEDAQASMSSKFWGPYRAIRSTNLAQGGSVVLFSGAAGRRPSATSASLSAINAAVEALGKALALELAPIRVNVISPGLIASTGWSEAMTEAARSALFEGAAARSPIRRVGMPDDVAAAVLFVLTNPNITGAVIDVDAGALLV